MGGGFKRSAHSADPERCIQLCRPSTARRVVHGKITSMEFRWVEITIMGLPRADPYPCSWSGTPIGRRNAERRHDTSRCIRSRQDASRGSPTHGQREDVVDPVVYDPTQEAHGSLRRGQLRGVVDSVTRVVARHDSLLRVRGGVAHARFCRAMPRQVTSFPRRGTSVTRKAARRDSL